MKVISLMRIFLREIIWFLRDRFPKGSKFQRDKGSKVLERAGGSIHIVGRDFNPCNLKMIIFQYFRGVVDSLDIVGRDFNPCNLCDMIN